MVLKHRIPGLVTSVLLACQLELGILTKHHPKLPNEPPEPGK